MADMTWIQIIGFIGSMAFAWGAGAFTVAVAMILKEKRQHRSRHSPRRVNFGERDLSGAFAVPDTEAWWLAVHQIIDQAELETIAGARRVTHDSNRCIAAVGAGEGCELIRTKLNEARDHALTHYRAESVK